jgi:hypothetical protein
MSEPHNIFSKEDIEWFDQMAEIMERAVAKARAENRRLGIDSDKCVAEVFPDSKLISKND